MIDSASMDDKAIIDFFTAVDVDRAAVTVEDDYGALFDPTHLASESTTFSDIRDYVKAVAKCDLPAFKAKIIPGQSVVFSPTKLGSIIYDRLPEFLAAYRPHYAYSEHLEAFYRSCIALGLLSDKGAVVTGMDFVLPSGELFKTLNVLVGRIRTETTLPWFLRAQVVNRQQISRKKDGIENYIKSLRRKYGALLFVRVDFSYLLKYRHRIDSDTFFKHVKEFARSRKRIRGLSHFIGCIYATEQGEEHGGYHVHAMLIFNGDKAQGAWYRSQLAGLYWKNKITGGMGHFHNPHDKVHKYKKRGMGMVRRDEHDILKNVIEVAQYFVKGDQPVLAIPGGSRTFATGRLPK